MKNLILFLSLLLVGSFSSFAQTNVQLKINHKLAGDDFKFNTPTKNNLDNDFDIIRLQYYISDIKVVHDGGMETIIDRSWALIDASESSLIDLGNLALNNVEFIKFSVGVDEASNHSDPSTYPAGHPLAPVFPSMHWGWAAGYRFMALEGMAGDNLNLLYQLHGLGDDNYFETSIAVNATAQNDELIINITGDYTKLLEDINMTNAPIVHGDNLEAKKMLENCRDHVFSASDLTATVDFSEIKTFKAFPNPSQDGQVNILIEAVENLTYQLTITDIFGREIEQINTVKSNTPIALNIQQSGLYFINLIKENTIVITKKIMVK